MDHKDSAEDFLSNIWPSWICRVYSIATTFVWVDKLKKQPSAQIKKARTRTARSGKKVLWPDYTLVLKKLISGLYFLLAIMVR